MSCKNYENETSSIWLDQAVIEYQKQRNINILSTKELNSLLQNKEFFNYLLEVSTLYNKMDVYKEYKNFTRFTSIEMLENYIYKRKLREEERFFERYKELESKNKGYQKLIFIEFLRQKNSFISDKTKGNDEEFLRYLRKIIFMEYVSDANKHYQWDKKNGVEINKRNTIYVSNIVKNFPDEILIQKVMLIDDNTGRYGKEDQLIRQKGLKERVLRIKEESIDILKAAEKFIENKELNQKEKEIIDDLERRWDYAGNYVRELDYMFIKIFVNSNLTETERKELKKLYYGPLAVGCAVEGLKEETGELIAEAIRKRDSLREHHAEIEINSQKQKADYFLRLMLMVLFSAGPVFGYAIKRFREDKKIFTEEEKQIIEEFVKYRKEILLDPKLLKDIEELKNQILNNVDNPQLGNISEIQRKLKIIMSKYNEFHLCAIEKIKHGKYYQLRKRQSPRKYGGEGKVLQKVLADHYGINRNKICVFDNGSSEGLSEIIKEYGKEKAILVETPTYGPIYDSAREVAGNNKSNNLITSTFEPNKGRDLEELRLIINEKEPGLVILCNPGNPFGQFTEPEKLYEFCNENQKTMFLIDEAYLDFYEAKQGRITNYDNLPPNVICLRTFSKMHGLAGLRIGYAISSRKHIKKLESFPFMKFLIPEAEYSAAHSIDQYKKYTEKYIKPAIEDNLEEMKKYQEYFGKENVYYSEAPNMVLIRLKDLSANQAKILDAHLRIVERVYINFFGAGSSFDSNKIGFDEVVYIRISLLDKKTNNKIIKGLIKAIDFVRER